MKIIHGFPVLRIPAFVHFDGHEPELASIESRIINP